jgi:hypothetical protein
MKRQKSTPYALGLELDDPQLPLVSISQDNEATIFLTMKSAARLARDLEKIVKKQTTKSVA